MTRIMALALVMAGLGAPALAEVKDAKGLVVKLPSGAEVRWLETRHDNAGSTGLTYRFRFLMPDLAKRAPEAAAAPTLPEAERGPIDIDTETETDEVTGGAEAGAEAGADMAPEPTEVTADASAGADAGADDGTEAAADAMVDAAADPDAVEEVAPDPLHDDVVWLCEHWVLPRVAAPAPRPSQIIISLSDKEVPFGAYDPHAVQVFEAFSLPADRSACEWEPW